jgi:NAD(P)-dependent dehydrogenase (short-subunit alcohol dehydrogenase family)
MGKLHGKVAVVTGASTGIGFAIAKRFVDEGAFVFITGRRQEELDDAVKAIGSNVVGVRGDVSKLQDLDRLYETVKAKGKIDVLVANAGTGEFAPLAGLTEEHFDKLFDLNVKGTVFTVQKALTLINDGGSIVLIGSVASSQSGANLDHGAERPSHSFERRKPRSDQDGTGRSTATGSHCENGSHHSDGTHGRTGRSRQGSGVPGLRRFQLCHGHRTIRRWRPRPSLIRKSCWRVTREKRNAVK